MKQYLNKRFAKKLLFIGGIMVVISSAISLLTVFDIYGKVDNCLVETAKCTLSVDQVIAKVTLATSYIGIALVLIGLTILIISLVKQKR